MRLALDRFEVEGIGHNLPFLSAVMDHPKFISGDMTTAFIAEEYPEGFTGVELDDSSLRAIAASCAAMNRVAEIRRAKISGRLDNHERKVGDDWIVTLQGQNFPVKIAADQMGSDVRFEDGSVMRVSGNWTPGQTLADMTVDGQVLVMKVGKISGGFRIRSRGADLKVHVRSPRQAELAQFMIEKLPPDTSKMLLCPMPGLIVKVNVEVGQEVNAGDGVLVLEAMKMENQINADVTGTVAEIKVSAGETVGGGDTVVVITPAG